MFCRECGKEFEGKFCPQCGEPAQEQHHENISTAPVKKPINKNLSTVLWLIFFFPVGLYFMWKSGWDKSIKAAISIFFGVVVITIALGGENWPFALSLIGFFGFIGSVVYLVVTIIKKQFPKTALVAMGLCFFAFMGGIVNSTSDSANPAITDTDVKVPATSSQQSNDKSSAEQSSSNGFADGFKEGFNGSSSSQTSSSQIPSLSEPPIDPQLTILLDGNINEIQAKNYLNIAKLCEINDVSKVTHELPKESQTDTTVFSIETKDGVFLVSFSESDTVNFVSDDGGQELYNNGTVNADFVFWKRFSYGDLQNYVKGVINSGLVSPSTAKYPGGGFLDPYDGWTIGRKKNNMYLASYVDSQNGFGATIRTKFECELGSAGDGKMKMIYLKTDDKVQLDNRKGE